MALSGINDLSWYIQQLSAQSGIDSATSAAASGSAVAYNGAIPGNASSALGQNLQVFMQALFEALSSTDPSTKASSSATTAGAAEDAALAPSSSQRTNQTPYGRSYAPRQSQGGLYGKIETLIGALDDQGGSSHAALTSASATGNLGGLQAAFNRLLQDLGGDRAGASSDASFESLSSLSVANTDLTLHGWLKGLQQNLRQPGTASLSALGNLVDVVV